MVEALAQHRYLHDAVELRELKLVEDHLLLVLVHLAANLGRPVAALLVDAPNLPGVVHGAGSSDDLVITQPPESWQKVFRRFPNAKVWCTTSLRSVVGDGSTDRRNRFLTCPIPHAPRLEPMPEWRGTRNRLRGEQLDALKGFIVTAYDEGKSLRQIAELTDRTWSDIRAILATTGVPRRPPGAVNARMF